MISSLIGIDNRTTIDMDATVKGIELTKSNITEVIKEILSIHANDGVMFVFKSITEMKEKNNYQSYRVNFSAIYGKINNPMKLDLTTGDEITPNAIQYKYPMMFDDDHIKVITYPLETILSEKIETIISRNISTTRMRDFYDVYYLYKLYNEKIDYNTLSMAIQKTSSKRNSLEYINNFQEIFDDILLDDYLKQIWENYRKDNPYVSDIELDDALKVLKEIFDRTQLNLWLDFTSLNDSKNLFKVQN